MEIMNLTDKEIAALPVDSEIQFVTKRSLPSHAGVVGIFKWGVQAWAVTVNKGKVPIKPNPKSIFVCQFASEEIQKYIRRSC